MAAHLDLAQPPAVIGAATPGAEAPSHAGAPPREDPWEGMNRGMFGFGNALDKAILRPLAMSYRHWLPRPVRHGLHNALSNLDEPVIAINDGLQGRPVTAGKTVLRFATNTTVGLVGLFDPATSAQLLHHDNDFGVTLGVYHMSAGPYLYVPLFGPSSVRGLVGAGVDYFIDPLNWLQYRHATAISTGVTVLGALDTRADVDAQLTDLNETSIDPYAALRSIYLQSKESQVRGGAVDMESLPDFPEETPASPPTGAPAPQTRAPEAPSPQTPALQTSPLKAPAGSDPKSPLVAPPASGAPVAAAGGAAATGVLDRTAAH
jgi:phospholipid-binding lipoprotein MlaA